MNRKKKYILIFVNAFLLSSLGWSQCLPASTNCDCGVGGLSINTLPNLEMLFDSFSEYNGGITLGGSSIVKVNIAEILPPPFIPCRWKLAMNVSNFAWGNPTEWDQLAVYGTGAGGSNPKLDLLQVRVTNGCNTPILSGTWQTFPALSGGSIDIIPDVGYTAMTPPGVCAPLVNGPGSYLQNYNEYTFTIDYRIQPGVDFQPGRYDLKIQFLITAL